MSRFSSGYYFRTFSLNLFILDFVIPKDDAIAVVYEVTETLNVLVTGTAPSTTVPHSTPYDVPNRTEFYRVYIKTV